MASRISLQSIADRLDCSRQFVSDLERGRRSSGDVTLWMGIASALGADRDAFLLSVWKDRGALLVPAPINLDESVSRLLDRAERQSRLRSR